jgi:hypothetical protein
MREFLLSSFLICAYFHSWQLETATGAAPGLQTFCAIMV